MFLFCKVLLQSAEIRRFQSSLFRSAEKQYSTTMCNHVDHVHGQPVRERLCRACTHKPARRRGQDRPRNVCRTLIHRAFEAMLCFCVTSRTELEQRKLYNVTHKFVRKCVPQMAHNGPGMIHVSSFFPFCFLPLDPLNMCRFFFVLSQHISARHHCPGHMERVRSWMSRSGSHVQNAVTRRSSDLSMEDAMQDAVAKPLLVLGNNYSVEKLTEVATSTFWSLSFLNVISILTKASRISWLVVFCERESLGVWGEALPNRPLFPVSVGVQGVKWDCFAG